MNWIPFAERRPEAEPNRYILLHTKDGFPALGRTGDLEMIVFNEYSTHWSEIEPPNERQSDAKFISSSSCEEAKVNKPPKPDPFDEWWDRKEYTELDRDYLASLEDKQKWFAKAGWDAAIKWKEGK